MSSETIKPVAPELPPVTEETVRGLSYKIKFVVYWSFIGVGMLMPPAFGLYGTFF